MLIKATGAKQLYSLGTFATMPLVDAGHVTTLDD